MADNLIYPIGFDINKGIADAEKNWTAQQEKLNKIFKVTVGLSISPKAITNLEEVATRLKQIKLQPITPETKTAIESLVKELSSLEKILKRIDKLNAQRSKTASQAATISAQASQREAAAASSLAQAAARRAREEQIRQNTADKARLAEEQRRQAVIRTQIAEERLAQIRARSVTGINDQNRAYATQSGLLNGLKQSMNAYVSILGASRLASNIKDVTAEFEKQKVALGAILQDKGKADELFNQVVQLAVKSPFQIKELIGYTKQLAAYRIQTDQLFDTTKRLADVSAGLGVEMGRIILAYGQVSAASVLRGQEVRQFTEAGIPLIALLAEKFEKLNGEAVTTGDVFKLISERAVPFKMVKDIFEDMTNESGIFFNMQEKMANTLDGVYSNLTDAWDVAFNEIGQDNMGLIKGLGLGLTDLAKNWRTIETTIKGVVVVFGAYQIAMRIHIAQAAFATQAVTLQTVAAQRYAAGQYAAAAATTSASFATNVFTRSLWRMYAAILANPFVAWMTAIAAVGYALFEIITYESQLDRLNKKLREGVEETRTVADASVLSFDYLMKKLESATRYSQEYSNIIEEINRRYGSFLPNQLKVTDSYDAIKESVKGVTEALMERAKTEAYTKGLSEIEKDYADTMQDSHDKVIKSLTSSNWFENKSFTFSKEQAEKIYGDALQVIRDSPSLQKSGKELSKFIEKSLNDGLSSKGIDTSKIKINLSSHPQFSTFTEELKEVANKIGETKEATEGLDKSIESTYGSNTPAKLKKELDLINSTYDKQLKQLDKTVYADSLVENASIRKVKQFDIEKARLTQLIEVYKKYNNFKMSGTLSKELDKLEKKGESWQIEVEKIIGSTAIPSKFAVSEEEDIFDYIDRLAAKRKELVEQDKKIKKGLLVPEFNKKAIEQDIATLDALGKALNADLRGKSETKGDKSAAQKKVDEFVKELKNEVKAVKEAYSKYQDLKKTLPPLNAQAEIDRLYKGQVTRLDVPFTAEDVTKQLQKALELGQKYLDSKEKLDINLDISDANVKALSEKMKKELDKLGEDIKKQQESSNFFEKLLGLGVDPQLSADLSLNFYGFNPTDIRNEMTKQLQDALGGIELDITPEGTLDFSKIAKRIDLSEYSEEQKKVYLDLLQTVRDSDIGVLTSLYSNLGKYADFESKKTEITRLAEKEREEIRKIAPKSEQKNLEELSIKKQKKDIANLTFDEFKESDMYIKMFEDLDRISTSSLLSIRSQLGLLKSSLGKNLDPTQLKDFTKKMEQLDKAIVIRNPFEAFLGGLKETKEQTISLKDANKQALKSAEDYALAQKTLADLEEKRIDKLAKGEDIENVNTSIKLAKILVSETKQLAEENADVADSISKWKTELALASIEMGGKLQQAADIAGSLKDAMSDWGVEEETSETMATLGDVTNVLAGSSQAAIGFGKIMSGDVLGGVNDMIKGLSAWGQGMVGIFTGANRKAAKANKEIKKQNEILKNLTRSYDELERAMDSALGSDYAKNNLEQIKNLEAQQIAYQKQLEAEKTKGKKKDKEKIAQYEQDVIDTQNAIKDKQKELSEALLGTDVGSAARDFASEWLDAYLSFDNTTDAIKDKFKDMMNNMLVEAILAKVIQAKVEKMFADVGDIFDTSGNLQTSKVQQLLDGVDGFATELNNLLGNALSGLNLESLKDQSKKELTGIAKAVGSLSEESALTLAGIANSGLYYNIGQFNQLVSINNILLRWEASRGLAVAGVSDNGGIQSLIAVQSLAIGELQKISASTRALAESNRELVNAIESVTSPLGARSGTRALNVNI